MIHLRHQLPLAHNPDLPFSYYFKIVSHILSIYNKIQIGTSSVEYRISFISTVPSAPESFPVRLEDSQLCLPQVHPALADYQDLPASYP